MIIEKFNMLFSNLTQITILPHWSGCQNQPEYFIKIQFFFPVKPYDYVTFLLNIIFQYLSTFNYNSILVKLAICIPVIARVSAPHIAGS